MRIILYTRKTFHGPEGSLARIDEESYRRIATVIV